MRLRGGGSGHRTGEFLLFNEEVWGEFRPLYEQGSGFRGLSGFEQLEESRV